VLVTLPNPAVALVREDLRRLLKSRRVAAGVPVLRLFVLIVCFAVIPRLAGAGDVETGRERPRAQCGAGNSRPFARKGDGRDRACDREGQRNYVHRHGGIGFDILDSESEACFVPDQEYRLLDELIDEVLNRTSRDTAPASPSGRARHISQAVSDVLTKRGFALYVDTQTLSDALIDRSVAGETERHIFDCDTGSLIFITVAENIGASVALVEIPLPHSTNHHNYIRWLGDEAPLLEWDLNLKSECVTPPGLSGDDGKSLSRDQTLGYALSLRAKLWERQARYDRAISDYQTSMQRYQGSSVYNNFAWLVATREVPRRKQLQQEALTAAARAVSMWPTANYRDTLACVHALQGDWPEAVKYETEAISETGGSPYKRRLRMFERDHKDCTGQ
jgi:hypothetical protein